MDPSLKYTLAIHLHTLKSINANKYKSCFQIRLTVHCKDEQNKKIIGTPSECLNVKKNTLTRVNTQSGLTPVFYETPKILPDPLSKEQTPIQIICIFKGTIPIKQKIQDTRIFVVAQLLWGVSAPEVFGQWSGYVDAFCFSSGIQFYFSNRFLSYSVKSTAHCMVDSSDFNQKGKFEENQRNIEYYNLHKKLKTSLYHCVLDPLIYSLDSLKKWNKKLRKIEKNKESYPLPMEKGQWKYARLRKMLEEAGSFQKQKIDYRKTQQILRREQYLVCIKADSGRISEYIQVCWKDFLYLVLKYPNSLYFQQLHSQYRLAQEKNNWANHYVITDAPANKNSLQLIPSLQCQTEDLHFHSYDQHQCKILFSQKDLDSLNNQVSKENHNLLILVHGFQASTFDMEEIAAFFRYRNPTLYILISESNVGMTQSPIEECAHRLALEVKNYLNTHSCKNINISFFGHSLGGLIIRAALKYLQLYKSNFYLYISMCSPHLGYLYHTSNIIKTSMWFLNKFKKDQSMIELTMTDNEDLSVNVDLKQKTFLYELSECNGLALFEKVIVFGSKQDQFVPFDSAMLLGRNFLYETNSSKIHQKMYQNMVQKIQDKTIRFELVFKDKVTDLSDLIGRTAHIKVLSYLPMIDLYVNLVSSLF